MISSGGMMCPDHTRPLVLWCGTCQKLVCDACPCSPLHGVAAVGDDTIEACREWAKSYVPAHLAVLLCVKEKIYAQLAELRTIISLINEYNEMRQVTDDLESQRAEIREALLFTKDPLVRGVVNDIVGESDLNIPSILELCQLEFSNMKLLYATLNQVNRASEDGTHAVVLRHLVSLYHSELTHNPVATEYVYSIDCPMDWFCACPMMKPLIEEAKKLKLHHWRKVQISDPLPVLQFGSPFPNNPCDITLAVSATGVIAYYFQQGNERLLVLHDICSERHHEIPIEFWTQVGFYDDKILVLTESFPLREAPVSAAFEFNRTREFVALPTKTCSWATDLTRVDAKRLVIYTNNTPPVTKLYEYNVDTRVNKQLNYKLTPYLCPTYTGVNIPGVKMIFMNSKFMLYILYDDNSLDEFMAVPPGSVIILPSHSKPNDLRSSFVIAADCFIAGKRHKAPMKFACQNAIVRVHRDFFLLYDWKIQAFAIRRIVVN